MNAVPIVEYHCACGTSIRITADIEVGCSHEELSEVRAECERRCQRAIAEFCSGEGHFAVNAQAAAMARKISGKAGSLTIRLTGEDLR